MPKFVLAALAAAALAGPALAASGDGAPSQVLSTGNVDFSNTTAVRAFYGRLYSAAVAVCDADANVPRPAQTDISCVRKTMADAVRVARKPALTAMFHANQGGDASDFAGR